MYEIIGLIALYSTGHFFIIQKYAWEERTMYEKIVTVVGIVSISLIYLGIITS